MSAVFDPLRLAAVTMDVMVAGHGTSAGVVARQSVRLSLVLQAAQRGSRLYRERMPGSVTGSTPLSSLPVITRSELMQRFEDWVTDPGLKLQELRAFVADPLRVGEAYLDKYVVWESSGTSGEPGIFVQDAAAMAVYDSLEALRRNNPRSLARCLDPLYLSERTAFVGATNGHFASYVTLERLRRINPWMAGTTRSFSILQSVDELVLGLNEFAPTIVATYPTAAALLADEAQSGRLQIKPREVWTGGESLSAATRDRVQQTLACTVRNSYGASEFLAMGWECGDGHLHINADWVILEPVDERYRPVPAGQPSFTVLLTNLANTVQPLIRYDLGDQVTLHSEHCRCGSPLPTFDVQGRQDDALVMAGSQGRRVTLLPLALTTVLEDQAGVFDFQLRQKDDHTLALRLGSRHPDAQAAMARSRMALKAYAKAQGVASMCMEGELGHPLTRGRSGKVRRVIGKG